MSDQTYLLILRLLHIGFGIFWAGSAIYLSFFIDPAVKALGPDGTKFMQQLVKTNGFPIVILSSALITVITGILLIWKVSAGLQSQWLTTPNGMFLTAGSLLAIIAFLIGFSVNRPSGMRIAKIGKAIVASSGPPTATQLEQLKVLGKKIGIASRFIAGLLILAIIGMSIFRYV